jgi:hypothetical protein
MAFSVKNYCIINIEYIGGKLATHYHIKPKSHFLKFDPNDWFCDAGSHKWYTTAMLL